MANLEVEFCGLAFKNPIVVSSIEPTNSLEGLKRCVDAGAAGAVVKTITDMPQLAALTRHAKYAILDQEGKAIGGKVPRSYVFYSRSGYSTRPYREWAKPLREAQRYAEDNGAHIIGSVGAGTVDGWIEIAGMMEDCGLRMIELNFGCPHPSLMKGTRAGMLLGQDPELAAEITSRVAEAVKIPVIVKLTPQVKDVVEIAQAVKEAGASGVTVINRYVGFAVDIERGRPWIGGPAGVGGPWVRFLTLRWVHEIYTKVGIPIAGTNGIYDWREAVEFLMTGARLMEVGSVLMLKGYGHIERILSGLRTFMEEHGYESVEAMIGVASRRSKDYSQLLKAERTHAVVDHERCNRCWRCVESCFYGAMERAEEEVITRSELCIGCELCYNVCPTGAIYFEAS